MQIAKCVCSGLMFRTPSLEYIEVSKWCCTSSNKTIMVYFEEKPPPLKLNSSRDLVPLAIQVKNNVIIRWKDPLSTLSIPSTGGWSIATAISPRCLPLLFFIRRFPYLATSLFSSEVGYHFLINSSSSFYQLPFCVLFVI